MRLTLSASTSPAVAATPRYTLRCPDRRPPDANVFLELEERLREILSVTPRELGNTRRTRILVTPDNEGTICSCGGARAISPENRNFPNQRSWI